MPLPAHIIHARTPSVTASHLFYVLLVMLVVPVRHCLAQTGGTPDAANAGLPVNGVFSGNTIDSVQLNNGNLHIDIPLLTLSGVGVPLRIHFVYDSKIWNYTYDQYNYYVNQDSAPSRVVYPGAARYRSTSHASNINCDGVTSTVTILDSLSFVDEDGTAHPFPVKGGLMTGGACGPAAPLRFHASDASGIVADRIAGSDQLADIKTRAGTTYFLSGTGSGNVIVEDSNGNELTFATSYNSDTRTTDQILSDTAGRSVHLSSTYQNGNQIGAISYTDQNGRAQTITITYTTVPLNAASLCALAGKTCIVNAPASLIVPSAITLQDGSSYQLQFLPNGLGDLGSVTLPTGATITYVYGQMDVSGDKVLSRSLSVDGQTAQWQYQYNMATNSAQGQSNTVVVTDPLLNDTRYTCTIYGPKPLGVDSSTAQLPPCYMTEQEVFDGRVSADNTLVAKTTSYTITGVVLPTATTTTWLDTGQTTETDTTWDSLPYSGYYANTNDPTLNVSAGNVMSQTVYDYGSGSHGGLLRSHQYSYLYQQASQYANLNILDRQVQDSLYDSQSTLLAQTMTTYDNFDQSSINGQSGLLSTTGTPNHDYTNFSNSATLRGVPTSTTLYLGPGTSPITTYTNANDLGMATIRTDGRGYSTNYQYGSRNAFLSSTILPSTGGVTHVLGESHDINTGLLASQTDENANVTTYTYDSLLRPHSIVRPDGGATTYDHPDPNHELQSITKDASTTTDTTTILDGLGRTIQTQLTSDPTGTVFTDTSYDLLGRVLSISNPYHSTADSTYGVTTFAYDSLGRSRYQCQTDNGTSSTSCVPGTSYLQWSYLGNTITSNDENGNSTLRTYDALNRLTQVMEPGALTTTYQYDALNNITCADQWGTSSAGTPCASGHMRRFTYDSLSRLITSSNPESGTVCYGTWSGGNTGSGQCQNGYDFNSNLLARTDARGATSTFAYDALNRLYQKTYTTNVNGVDVAAPTPSVFYTFDTSSQTGAANTIGRLTGETVQQGSTVLFQRVVPSYTSTGLLATDKRCVPYFCSGLSTVTYTYDMAGNEITATTDDGTTYQYGYDSNNRMTSQSFVNAAANLNGSLLEQVQYSPLGGITAANGFESRDYDVRGRTTNIIYSSSDYGLNYTSTYHYYSNGNVQSNADSVNGNWTYGYDSLNRLTSATSADPAVGTQTYTFDSFGNRLSQSGVINNSATYNNNFNQPDCVGCYDSAGHLIYDGNAFIPHTYTYDAEGRLSGVTDLGYQYLYDGEGTRIGTTQNGTPLREYFREANNQFYVVFDGNGSETSVEFFGAGRHIFTFSDDTYLPILDALGTERSRQGLYGGTTENCTNLPFGDGLSCSASDPSPLHFTGKERDAESGLDYFEARYYGSNMGRFMSPDPLGGHLENPQSLNKYAYALNNPLTNTDPTGLDSYLQCTSTKDNASTCQSQRVGGTDDKPQMANVQGVTGANGFTATRIGNNPDGSAGLVDLSTGTGSYTASVNGSGVQFSNDGGKTSSTGVFDNGTPQTKFQDAGFANGGALSGFSFTLTNSKLEAGQTEAGFFNTIGTQAQAESALQRAGFQPRAGTEGGDEFRSRGSFLTGANSGHFIVSPNASVPKMGDMHFGEHNPYTGAGALYHCFSERAGYCQ